MFSGSLTDLPSWLLLFNSAAQDGHMSRFVGWFRTRKSATYTSRTFETFGWHAKEYLGALLVRNNTREAHFKWTTVWCCPRWPTCAKLRHICSSGTLYSATLTGTSSLVTLSNRIAMANWSSKSHLLRAWRSSQTLAGWWKTLGTTFPENIRTRGVIELSLYILKINPSNLFTAFIPFIFLS